MDIYNEIGELLESDLNLVKVDLVLSVDFARAVSNNNDQDTLNLFSRQYGVPIYPHDVKRTIRICHLVRLFASRASTMEGVIYFQDSLMVIYEWIIRYRIVYGARNHYDAYAGFLEAVSSSNAHSVLSMKSPDVSALFHYLYARCLLDPIGDSNLTTTNLK